MALTETWPIFNNEILPVDFAIYCKDRGSRGGGVMLAVRDCISSKLISSPDNLEIITVSVNTVHPTTFCAIYLPPNSLPEYAQLTFDYIKELCSTTASIIILGDLNLPDINWETLSGGSQMYYYYYYYLQQDLERLCIEIRISADYTIANTQFHSI